MQGRRGKGHLNGGHIHAPLPVVPCANPLQESPAQVLLHGDGVLLNHRRWSHTAEVVEEALQIPLSGEEGKTVQVVPAPSPLGRIPAIQPAWRRKVNVRLTSIHTQ